jgi:selenocysteine-specific translation elongation factor
MFSDFELGDKLLVMPINEVCTVKGIRSHGNNVEHASAGMCLL